MERACRDERVAFNSHVRTQTVQADWIKLLLAGIDRIGSGHILNFSMTWEQFKKHVRNLIHGRHNSAEHDWQTDPNQRIAVEQPLRNSGTTANSAERKLKRRKKH